MDTFITIAICLIVLFFFIDGIRRGLVRQLFEIVGLIVAFTSAYYFGHYLTGRFGDGTRISSGIVLFFFTAVAFIIVILVFGLLGRLFQKIMSVTILSPVDKVGGAAFGALKGVLFVSLLCVLIHSLPSLGGFKETLRANRVAAVIHPVLPRMYNFFMRYTPSRIDEDYMVRVDETREPR